MTDYCASSDLYAFGVPRGAIPNPARTILSVTGNVLTLDEHGFAADDAHQYRADGGGALPAPLVEGDTYYAIPIDDSRYSVAAAPGGAAIDLTTEGESFLVIVPLDKASAIRWASRFLDSMLPAHVVPLTAPVPEIVKMVCAELAAWKLLSLQGAQSRSLMSIVDEARKVVDKWAKGVPIRGENAPTRANLAVAATAPHSDPRGWREFGGL